MCTDAPRVPFYSNDADSETLFPKYSLKIHFYERTRGIARRTRVFARRNLVGGATFSPLAERCELCSFFPILGNQRVSFIGNEGFKNFP